jgi:cyclophilin family peptidyl-prolyl cis-trans isomerase
MNAPHRKTTASARHIALSRAVQDASPVRSSFVAEHLEARRLLAAPEILDFNVVDEGVPAGKNLYVPIAVNDADGDSVTITAQLTDDSDDGSVTVLPRGTFIDINVEDFGTMTFQLFDNVAPETVRRITGLAESGYYDNVEYFRVIDDFIIQTGDPTENGANTNPLRARVDFQFDDEFDPDFLFTGDGQLAMANAGRDTNTSQFFVTEGDQRFLDGNFTLFGQLIRGFDVRDAISEIEVGGPAGSTPTNQPVVSSIDVVQNDTDAVLRVSADSGLEDGDEIEVRVTAVDENGDEDSRRFTVDVFEEGNTFNTGNAPAVFLPFDDNRVTDTNTAIVFQLPAADPEGDDLEYIASFGDFANTFTVETTSAGVGTLSVDNDEGTVTFTPATDFTGAATFDVFVRDEIDGTLRPASGSGVRGNSNFAFDSQEVTVVVGDEGASTSDRSLVALPDVPLQDVVVATFTDEDPSGTAGDWDAIIDWGDGLVDDGDNISGAVTEDLLNPNSLQDNPVVVRAGSTPGTFEVVGSHTYRQTGDDIPITVTITSGLGTELEVVSSVDVVEPTSYNPQNGFLQINGTTGVDTITAAVDGSNLNITVNGDITTRDVSEVGLLVINALEGDDTITLGSDVVAARVEGGAGDDTITGSSGNDELNGGDGDDVIDGRLGNDSITGGDGDDYLAGGLGLSVDDETADEGYFDRDTIRGGDGNDTLTGGLDVNLLFGDDGDDLLNGSGSRDDLEGGAGNDRLRGFGNDDSLVGGDGADTLLGDDGDAPAAEGGADTLEGGNGADILRGFFANDLFRGGSGDDTLFGGDGDDTDEDREAGDVIDSIENSI